MSTTTPATARSKSPSSKPYHHGALQQALVEAAEAILAERGVEGFTLREAARRAGVSPAAPAHHFGSVAGLLTEVAILGFEALTQYLREGSARGGADPFARLHQQGLGYVRFALAYPARFHLMFRSQKLRPDERLRTAGRAAFSELEVAMRDYLGLAPGAALEGEASAFLLGAWSAVHGFAHLALDGKLGPAAGPEELQAFVEERLPPTLEALFPPRDGGKKGQRKRGGGR